jgi:exoribonuclease-2
MGVRTSTHSQPHMAMGVPAYMWSTSPLRRYTDWFNQIQLLAAIKDGVAAPMTAPFKLREVDVLTRMGNFDEKYKAYNEQQNKMEKYWCLQWVNQHLNEHGFLETNAILIKEGMLRLKELPLYVPCVSVPAETPLQSSVVVRLSRVDLAQLTVDVALVSVMAAEAELA